VRGVSFMLLTLLLLASCVGGGSELAVRALVDDGMQYDLEMWKYARLGKRISADAGIGHEHVPGARFRAMGVDVRINALGLRGGEVTTTPAPGRLRILMLGDSLTFGWGVAEPDTVPRRLELLLRDAGIEAEVLNAGVGNTNTSMQVAWYARHGRALDADLVILNYFVNDAEPTPGHEPPSWLERHSYAWIYLGSRLDVALRMLDSRQDWRQYYRGLYRPGAPGWEGARQAMARLAQLCGEDAVPLLVVNYPELRELVPYPFADESRMLAEAVRVTGARYLDLLPALAGLQARDLWVTEPDPHPNAVADGAFAAAVQREVLSMLRDGESAPGAR
jgi:lysophospholipase L1-like esterase